MERPLGAVLGPLPWPLLERVPPVLGARQPEALELVDHQHGRVAGGGAVDELRRVDLQAAGHAPPEPLSSAAVGRVLLDEAVLLELAEVVARGTTRLTQHLGELGGRRRAVHAETVADLHTQWMGQPAQRSGVHLASHGVLDRVGGGVGRLDGRAGGFSDVAGFAHCRSLVGSLTGASARRARRRGDAGRRPSGFRRSARSRRRHCSTSRRCSPLRSISSWRSVAMEPLRIVCMGTTVQLAKTSLQDVLCNFFFANVSWEQHRITPAVRGRGR